MMDVQPVFGSVQGCSSTEPLQISLGYQPLYIPLPDVELAVPGQSNGPLKNVVVSKKSPPSSRS
jgi:hypothetical protein